MNYIITQDYFDTYANILEDSDFIVGTIVTQDEDGTLHLADQTEHGGHHTNGDPGGPQLPPPVPPKI